MSTSEEYRIGAVCRLTGLSPHVLRVWEKRYGVVTPGRSSSQRRLYSEADIKKLSLLKALVDRGQAIGTLSELDMDELERRVEDSVSMFKFRDPKKKPRLVVIGSTLRREATDWNPNGFEIVDTFDATSEFVAQETTRAIDVVVLEWPSVHPDTGTEIARLLTLFNVSRIFLVYDYASTSSLRKLNTSRITAVKTPLSLVTLEALIGTQFGQLQDVSSEEDLPSAAPPRRFSEDELAYIGQQTTSVACECPRHLSELISSLGNFETYSAECESRNEQDAAVHGYLYAISAQARSLLEKGLTKVIEVDGLKIREES